MLDAVDRALSQAAHHLPAQAALEVFVHHNTLHAFQAQPFHQGVAAAREVAGGEGYLPEGAYRAAFASGRISPDDLDAALRTLAADALPLPAMPAGLPDARAVARVVLVEEVRALTRSGLAWRLAEDHASTSFLETVSSVARERIIRETTPWLADALEREDLGRVVELLVGDAGPGGFAEFAEEFGRPTRARLGALLERSPDRLAVAALWTQCRAAGRRSPEDAEVLASRLRPRLLRQAIVAAGGDDPNELVHPPLIVLSAAFLDRGQSHWSMPDRERGFFVAFCRILGAGHAIRPAWQAALGGRLRGWTARETGAAEATLELLGELGVAKEDVDAYVERTLLELPGWAGMFRRLEEAPGPIGRSPALVRLADFLAVRLLLDSLAAAEMGRRLGYDGPLDGLAAWLDERRIATPESDGDHRRAWPLFVLAQHLGIAAPELGRLGDDIDSILALLRRVDRPTRLRLWHEAYERHYREDLLRAIQAHRPTERASTIHPRFQLLTCIDDRSEGLRRHFEELSAEHVTFGAAGFFNLAIAYQGVDDPTTFPLCPVILTARHAIREEPISEHVGMAARRMRRRRALGSVRALIERSSKSIFWGPIVTAVTGFVSALPLLAVVFAPFAAARVRRRVESWLLPVPKTRLTLPRADDEGGPDGGREVAGFTIEEKAARVGALLEDIGLVRGFARIVVICGHDSSSVNNPHVAAYSCGACGGRSGGPNARLFARMANRPEVRARLRERGIEVPDTTFFVGAVHDTCADRMTLFDVDTLPLELMPEVTALQAALDEATQRHAHERCRRFVSAPRKATFREASHHVEARGYDLSQARPELGHATNAACVVGRRALTRDLFLDRRVFLASYDPTRDPEGAILERILTAVAPVGAGINLEYFFSTCDREHFGAGTKLPHNVTGLVGVMNGASSDLRTGLPAQMIEIHEPIRLQLVLETTRAIAAGVLARRPEIAELVVNEWVRLIVVDPKDGALWLRENGDFVPWESDGAVVPTVGRSLDWYRGRSDHLKPARIVSRADGARADVRATIGEFGDGV